MNLKALHPVLLGALLSACSGSPEETDEPIAPQPMKINELLASNDSFGAWTDEDEEEHFDDWIELYNAGDEPVELSGWTLRAIDEQSGWTASDGTWIDAGAYLLVWCSEADDGANHAPFKLPKAGGEITLHDRADALVDGVTYGEQETDVSLLRTPDGAMQWVTGEPTPSASNPSPD